MGKGSDVLLGLGIIGGALYLPSLLKNKQLGGGGSSGGSSIVLPIKKSAQDTQSYPVPSSNGSTNDLLKGLNDSFTTFKTSNTPKKSGSGTRKTVTPFKDSKLRKDLNLGKTTSEKVFNIPLGTAGNITKDKKMSSIGSAVADVGLKTTDVSKLASVASVTKSIKSPIKRALDVGRSFFNLF